MGRVDVGEAHLTGTGRFGGLAPPVHFAQAEAIGLVMAVLGSRPAATGAGDGDPVDAAATAALWAALSVHTLWAGFGASLVTGVAVTGTHYTGMAAVSVHLTGEPAHAQSSPALLSFLLSMIAGLRVVLLIAAVVVMFDPDMMLGATQRGAASSVRPAGGSEPVSQQQPTGHASSSHGG